MGPKFRQYFMLHLEQEKWLILWGIGFGLFVGWIWKGFEDYREIVLYGFLIFAVIWRDISKICSQMLYQREAYFYQSFPVTNFGTVLAKTVAVAAPIAAYVIGTVVVMYGINGVLMIPAIVSGGLLTGGIFLAAVGFGNSMRDSRAKKPSTTISVLAAALMLAAQIGLTAVFINWVVMGDSLKLLILTIVFTIEAAGMLWYDVRSLKSNYQV